MAGLVIRSALRRPLAQVRHVSPVRPGTAEGLVAAVYTEVERDFGMLAPPVALHSPAPELLAACWVMLRETLVATGPVERAAREAVAASVSRANSCPYCAEVHGSTLNGLLSGVGPQPGEEPQLTAGSAPELLGVAVTFHYLNRMVNVFLGESPIPAGAPALVRRSAAAVLGRFMARNARQLCPPGRSLDLLPAAPLPADLSWAAGTPSVAGAFARAAAAADAAGGRSVPASVRELVLAELDGWDGTPKGIGRGWVGPATAALPPAERPAGVLALLTALAAYQVDDAVVADFRRLSPADASLVELVSWSAMAAARRAGRRLAPEPAGGS